MFYINFEIVEFAIFTLKKNTSVYKIALKKPFIKIYIFDV